MKCLFWQGKSENFDLLYAYLEASGVLCTYLGKNRVILSDKSDILICNGDYRFEKRAPDIVVFDSGDYAKIPPRANTLAILHSDDKKALEILAKTGVSAVTVGPGGCDTITFSSILQDSCVISVNRRFHNIMGGEVEIAEIPLDIKDANEKTLLAVASILSLGIRDINII